MSEDSIFHMNIYFVQDEKDSKKYVYFVLFFMNLSFGNRELQKKIFTANAALRHWNSWTRYIVNVLDQFDLKKIPLCFICFMNC